MSKRERKQKTKQGYEIPVPKKGDVLGWIKKAAQGKGGSPKKV
jgi:hypothetical protein